ncbi:MAG: c-type cytochrome [Desulfobacterales bacterium]
MKKLGAMTMVLFFLTVPALAADSGEALFKSQGCTACHRPESSSKVNPSLMEIAGLYRGKQDQLRQYLNGEAEAIVKPGQAGMMKRYIEKTKQLSDAERQALAEYIMTFSK